MDAESRQVEDLKTEIERLKACAHSWMIKAEDRAQLISELADALEAWESDQSMEPPGERELIQRAREVTK